MPPGIGRDQYWYVGTKIVASHVNANPIGWYQKMTGPLYVDVSRRRVQSKDRYGAKIQYDRRDSLVSRYGNDTSAFIAAALRDQLAYNIAAQQELISRNGIIKFARNTFLYNGARFELGTNDFSHIPASLEGTFDVTMLEAVSLRMAIRSKNFATRWGNYASPVPGKNFRGSALVMVTTGTYWAIQNSPESEYMVNLYQMQDERIINGGQVQYRKFSTIVDTDMAQVLWNAGNIGKQVAVTEPINWGDGAPDPTTTEVDGIYLMGQEGAKHYVQCTDFDADDFAAGDRLSIHTNRTGEWGITDGCDWSHGKTMDIELYEIDAVNNRLIFHDPITEQYTDAQTYTSLGGVAASGQAYAYVTKAQHIHPVIVMAARETVQFVRRRTIDGNMIAFYAPNDEHYDYPSINRVTAEWYGTINQWNPYPIEIFFCAGPYANYGDVEY